MGLLQDIADSLSSDKLKQFQAGGADFEDPSSPDQKALQDLIQRMDPQEVQDVLAKSARQADPQEFSDHITPGAGGTNPLGGLQSGGLAAIAAALLKNLQQVGPDAGAQPSKIPGLQTTDPNAMDSDDVAKVARYAQQNHPEAFGKAAAEIGQQQPGLLNSFLGKSAMAVAAAALASHYIKTDR